MSIDQLLLPLVKKKKNFKFGWTQTSGSRYNCQQFSYHQQIFNFVFQRFSSMLSNSKYIIKHEVSITIHFVT